MTPTCVVSSRDTTGTLTAFGRRARQFDLFWSSKVYSTLTKQKNVLEEHDDDDQGYLPRIGLRGMSSLLSPLTLVAAAGEATCCDPPLSAGLNAGVAMAAYGLEQKVGSLSREWVEARRARPGREVVNDVSRSVAGVRSSRTRCGKTTKRRERLECIQSWGSP